MLHENEFTITETLVRRLIAQQAPGWLHLPLSRLDTSGTVNATFRLGDDMVVRLPRTADHADGPAREAAWMPVFAPVLPLRVPGHLFLGSPSPAYPAPWSVLEWVEGSAASTDNLADVSAAAETLGDLVRALQTVPTAGAPIGGSYRARGLRRVDRDFRAWVDRLPEDIDHSVVTEVWERCLAVGESTGAPRWMHSDLRGDNLIAHDGELVAVIDWEGCTVGDPSVDYLAAWWLFDSTSRMTFRTASGAGVSDWIRAKGWALHMAVAAIPYYSDSNPMFASQARRALTEVLSDDG